MNFRHSQCNSLSHAIRHFVLYRLTDLIVEIKQIITPVIKPENIFAKSEDKNESAFLKTIDIKHITIDKAETNTKTQICGRLK